MTRTTLRCPHCKSVLERMSGSGSTQIGNPIRECPFCGGTYIHSFVREWVNMSPFERFNYWISLPLCAGFLSFVILGGVLLGLIRWESIIAIIIAFVLSVLIAIGIFFARKEKILREKQGSIYRTKSAKYVEMLKTAGLRIYFIKGVDIGSEKDDDGEPVEEDNLKP